MIIGYTTEALHISMTNGIVHTESRYQKPTLFMINGKRFGMFRTTTVDDDNTKVYQEGSFVGLDENDGFIVMRINMLDMKLLEFDRSLRKEDVFPLRPDTNNIAITELVRKAMEQGKTLEECITIGRNSMALGRFSKVIRADVIKLIKDSPESDFYKL